MELAMQIISNVKTVRCDTVKDIIDSNSQSLATQAKKRRTTSLHDSCHEESF